MVNAPLNLSIGAVADAAGVNVETIRFYQRKGLLDSPQRHHGEMLRSDWMNVDEKENA